MTFPLICPCDKQMIKEKKILQVGFLTGGGGKKKCLPVFVDDDGWPWDVVATQQLLPQIYTGVQIPFLKVTLGHL